MTETNNLLLPQFEETDRIHHDDFNDAFGRIDAAVAAETQARQTGDLWVKLSESTLASARMSHAISGFSAAPYQQLKLLFELNLNYDISFSSNTIKLTLNNIATTSYYSGSADNNAYYSSDDMSSYLAITSNTGAVGGEVRLFPLGNTGTGSNTEIAALRVGGGFGSEHRIGGTGAVAFANLTALTITSSNASLPAGAHFVLYGMKK